MSAENPGRPEGSNGASDRSPQRRELGQPDNKRIFEKEVSEKAMRIASMVDRDAQTFRDWKQTIDAPRLDAPEDALRFLIPPRLLETVADPDALSVKVDQEFSGENKLLCFIVEHKPGSSQYEEGIASGVVDEDDVARRVVAPDEFVHNFVLLERLGESDDATLLVTSYVDREENRGKGIGKAFFDGLRRFGRETGFAYMAAETNEQNIGFFTDAVGMDHLTDTAPEVQEKFMSLVESEDVPYFTVLDLRESF